MFTEPKVGGFDDFEIEDGFGDAPTLIAPLDLSVAGPSDRTTGDEYEFGELLGRGAMGFVHKATHKGSGVDVAVKTLRTDLLFDDRMVERFVQEQQIQRRIDHPNVVEVFDLIAHEQGLGIVMEWATLGDFRSVSRSRSVSLRERIRIIAEIASGLGAIHSVDVVHRDLKPANILLDEVDGVLRPKISDLGVSRLLGEGTTNITATVGTPLYMAPEATDPTGPKAPADIYSLGIMLFEQLAGEPPFTGPSPMAILKAHADEEVPRIGGVPLALADLVSEMVAKVPSQRPTAAEVKRRLEDVLPKIDNDCKPYIAPPKAKSIRRTMAAKQGRLGDRAKFGANTFAAVALVGVLLITGLVWVIGRSGNEAQDFSFRPLLVDERVLVERHWTMSDGVLSSETVLTNLGADSIDLEHHEPMPTQLVDVTGNVVFIPEPSVIQEASAEPTAVFLITDLEPDASITVGYSGRTVSDADDLELGDIGRELSSLERRMLDGRAVENRNITTLQIVGEAPIGAGSASPGLPYPRTDRLALIEPSDGVRTEANEAPTSDDDEVSEEVESTETPAAESPDAEPSAEAAGTEAAGTEKVDTGAVDSQAVATTAEPQATEVPATEAPATTAATTTTAVTSAQTVAPATNPATTASSRIKLNPVVFSASTFEYGEHGEVTTIFFNFTYELENYPFDLEPHGSVRTYMEGKRFSTGGAHLTFPYQFNVGFRLGDKPLAEREICIELSRGPWHNDSDTHTDSDWTRKCEVVLSGTPNP